MLADLTESLFTPATFLWLMASAFAGMILLSAMNRRRVGLVESLKKFVDRGQKRARTAKPDADRSGDEVN